MECLSAKSKQFKTELKELLMTHSFNYDQEFILQGSYGTKLGD
jgi:hypothetical protein